MRRHLKLALLAASIGWVYAPPASAATLTLTDTFGGQETVWTLTVPDACTTCTVTLEADFDSTGVNPYAGQYLDSFQWVVTDPNVEITSISDLGANWETTIGGKVNANGCNDTGSDNFTCTEWTGTGPGLLISDNDQLSFSWNVTFASAVTMEEGNIRASFDKANDKNFNVFSPGGGFADDGDGDQDQDELAPEPAILTLLGAGLVVAGRRLRRKSTM